ncbi:MAG: hypothetical protein IPK60_01545 [Sandaracinaceae bacterium]|nr:hypothetical protein [Sandaracinaceae bacterium]
MRVLANPEFAGAYGAALVGRDQSATSPLSVQHIADLAVGRVQLQSTENTRCQRCELHCERTIATVEEPDAPPQTVVLGNACERGAELSSRGARTRRHAPDVFSEEARKLTRPVLAAPHSPKAPRSDLPVFGIPRVLAFYRCAPLLLHYLRAAGVPDKNVVLSPTTSPQLTSQHSSGIVADACFPVKVVHAHVRHLLAAKRAKPVDHILLPSITHAAIEPKGTRDCASCPIVAACGDTARASLRQAGSHTHADKVMSPHFTLSNRERLSQQLWRAFEPIVRCTEAEHEVAFQHAIKAQCAFRSRLRERGKKVVRAAEQRGSVVAVVLGRPYHADPGLSHGVSVELAARGIPVLGISSLSSNHESELDFTGELAHITNSGCAEKIWAARVIAANPNLLAVDLSSFRCGQDASVDALVKETLGDHKPSLRLHDLDEDKPTSSIRLRLDTFQHAATSYAERMTVSERKVQC